MDWGLSHSWPDTRSPDGDNEYINVLFVLVSGFVLCRLNQSRVYLVIARKLSYLLSLLFNFVHSNLRLYQKWNAAKLCSWNKGHFKFSLILSNNCWVWVSILLTWRTRSPGRSGTWSGSGSRMKCQSWRLCWRWCTVILAMVQHLFSDIIKQRGHKYATPSLKSNFMCFWQPLPPVF